MQRFALCLLCALLAACGAEEEPPTPTPYQFELAAEVGGRIPDDPDLLD